MPIRGSRLSLSPSECHHRVARALRPGLAFAGGDVGAWRRRLRRRLRTRLGLDAMPEPTVPLRPRTLWRRRHPLGVIEKVAFNAEPGADALAYVCLPAAGRPPYPFVICLQGHTSGMHWSIGVQRDDETAAFDVEGDRDFGLQCMERGYAALCLEQRSFGLRRERAQAQVSPHPCHDAAMRALLLGRTLLGERVYDVSRGLDYLAARGAADLRRVGVMGNSGGGTVAIYAAALLDRIAFAIPSCSFCTFHDSIFSIYHCADNYVPGLLRDADMADVLGLFAPKPLVVVAGRTDELFPLSGVRRAFRGLRRIYAAAGAPARCRLVVGEGGHRFYAEPAWRALERVLRTD